MSIYQMYINGLLDPAIEKKLIPAIETYCQIYKWFLLQRKAGLKYQEALEVASEDMNVSTRTVKRAISVVTK